jgi:hypothetical protein
LCLIKQHAVKIYEGAEVHLHAFLTVALDGGEWSAIISGCFNPEERAPSTNSVEGWMGITAGLETVEREEPMPVP